MLSVTRHYFEVVREGGILQPVQISAQVQNYMMVGGRYHHPRVQHLTNFAVVKSIKYQYINTL